MIVPSRLHACPIWTTEYPCCGVGSGDCARATGARNRIRSRETLDSVAELRADSRAKFERSGPAPGSARGIRG